VWRELSAVLTCISLLRTYRPTLHLSDPFIQQHLLLTPQNTFASRSPSPAAMAYGSATLPVRAKTKVTTKTKTTVKTSASAVASTSKLPAKGRKLAEDDSSQSQPAPKRRESLPDPTDSDDDDDPDFGRDAKEKTREEVEDLMEKEEKKRAKEEVKVAKALAKERGEVYVPPPKPKGKKARRSKVKDESEDEPVVRRPPPRPAHLFEPRTGDSTDSDPDKRTSKSRYDPEAKKRELSERTGFDIGRVRRGVKGKGKAKESTWAAQSSDSEEGEGYLKKRGDQYSYTGSGRNKRKVFPDTEQGRAAALEEHKKRRWVNKKNPERMSAYRKEMEELTNPLIQLLGMCLASSTTQHSLADSDSSTRRRNHGHQLGQRECGRR
jgi:hypothetical protein